MWPNLHSETGKMWLRASIMQLAFLASLDRRSENVRVLPVIIEELEDENENNWMDSFVNKPEKHRITRLGTPRGMLKLKSQREC